jgi:hypothetical protein
MTVIGDAFQLNFSFLAYTGGRCAGLILVCVAFTLYEAQMELHRFPGK